MVENSAPDVLEHMRRLPPSADHPGLLSPEWGEVFFTYLRTMLSESVLTSVHFEHYILVVYDLS